jgi:hypothetical protein
LGIGLARLVGADHLLEDGRTPNEDLMPFGMTDTRRRGGQTWRIVVAAIHAPDGGPGR